MATRAEFDQFVETHFVDQFSGLADDFCIWLRLSQVSWDEYSLDSLEWLFRDWSKSKRIGKHRGILDRRRRKTFGPGRYHASSSAGVFLNKNFVKGWRGINPRQP